MTQRTVHWIECDYGYCDARYTQERQREHNQLTGRKATLRQAAQNEGWSREGCTDLCIYHTEVEHGMGDQPALFAVSDPGDPV